jgi:AraC family transcriptional regulator, positive regulator of tynA and feaB
MAVAGPPRNNLTKDEWIALLRQSCTNEIVVPKAKKFVGWFQPYSVYGLGALTAGSNIERINRTPRHTRLDGLEDYSLIFQLKGRTAFDHVDRMHQLNAGDLILVDPTRPTTVFNEPGFVRHLALHLPRRQLVSFLGFEPNGDLHRSGTSAGRLLLHLMRDALRDGGDPAALPEPHMQMVVFDLLAALFTPERFTRSLCHSEKLFTRVRRFIETRFAGPDLTPATVASEARISIRYLQKLFSARGTTCGSTILSLRLGHAARLIQQRVLLRSEQPLSDIALACGFLDYAYFSRKFRERFGHPPSAHAFEYGRDPTNDRALTG